eukprot:1159045-Pelagomonas_calceolata.AAC.12
MEVHGSRHFRKQRSKAYSCMRWQQWLCTEPLRAHTKGRQGPLPSFSFKLDLEASLSPWRPVHACGWCVHLLIELRGSGAAVWLLAALQPCLHFACPPAGIMHAYASKWARQEASYHSTNSRGRKLSNSPRVQAMMRYVIDATKQALQAV